MKALRLISNSLYRVARATDAWVGLPDKVSESLHFRQDWRSFLPSGTRPAKPTVWIHGASVGELEDMGAFFLDPAMLSEAGLTASQIVLTASSVSAKERLEGWRAQGFAYAGPLPPESTRDMRAFLYILRPEIMVLSHTDIWPVALFEARAALARAALWLPARPPSSTFLIENFLSGFVRGIGCRSMADIEAIAAQGTPGLDATLKWIGNPRVDRILRRIEAAKNQTEHILEAYECAPRADRPTLIVGSCWLEDARALAGALAQLSVEEASQIQIVAIPHETQDAHLIAAIKGHLPQARVLPVQGILAEAYRGFGAAWIGGGFRTGLHNVLEPALWEIPGLCGPLTKKQPETGLLEKIGQLTVVREPGDATRKLRELLDPALRLQMRQNAIQAAEELRKHAGSTRRFVQLLKEMMS